MSWPGDGRRQVSRARRGQRSVVNRHLSREPLGVPGPCGHEQRGSKGRTALSRVNPSSPGEVVEGGGWRSGRGGGGEAEEGGEKRANEGMEANEGMRGDGYGNTTGPGGGNDPDGQRKREKGRDRLKTGRAAGRLGSRATPGRRGCGRTVQRPPLCLQGASRTVRIRCLPR